MLLCLSATTDDGFRGRVGRIVYRNTLEPKLKSSPSTTRKIRNTYLLTHAQQTWAALSSTQVSGPFSSLNPVHRCSKLNRCAFTQIYMFKYDPVHGRGRGRQAHRQRQSRHIFGERDPTAIQWSSAGAVHIVESTVCPSLLF